MFAVHDPHHATLIEALLVGGILADYVTWFGRTVITLPSSLLHGCYDVAINLVFGWYLFRISDLNVNFSGESLGLAFVSFMLVMGVKVTYYAFLYLGDMFKEME